MKPAMQLDQMVDKALLQFFTQCWPLVLLMVGVGLLKSLMPRRKDRKRTRKATTKNSIKLRTDEERDYDRRLAGVAGELKVRTFVERRYSSSLHDVYLPSKGGVTQIDHIVLAAGAIVVIETKNYNGLILGEANSHKWVQMLGRGGTKHPFMNPIHQNAGHVSAVRMAIGNDLDVTVINLVVFVGAAKFGRPLPDGVIILGDLGSRLDEIVRDHPADASARAAWLVLCESCLATPRSDFEAEHRQTLARKAKSKDQKAA